LDTVSGKGHRFKSGQPHQSLAEFADFGFIMLKIPFSFLSLSEIKMVSCVKCGKPIGLLEYALGSSKHLGLCKKCRKTAKWCDNCVYMLTISMENASIIRCIKYGYNLSNKKDWTTATNCQDFTSKIVTANGKAEKNNESQASSKISKTTFSKTRKGKPKGWF